MALQVRQLVLETGPRQQRVLALYSRAGFTEIDRFGEYIDAPMSVCLGKAIGEV